MAKSSCIHTKHPKYADWLVSSPAEDPGPPHSPPAVARTSRKRKTRLFLHFDINETILLGDEAGGDSRHDSVQKMLAKSAFCQLGAPTSSSSSSGDDSNENVSWDDTQQIEPKYWWDGQKMGEETSMPPLYTGWEWPPNCGPYYRTAYKKRSKRFVDKHDGKIYQPIMEACEEALAKGKDPSNHILPAFYETLQYLIHQYQEHTSQDGNKSSTTSPHEFRVIFRTFGSDVDELAGLITRFARGEHPDYPDIRFPELELPPERLYQGRWKRINTSATGAAEATETTYELWDALETKVVASGDEAILELLSQHTVCGIRDDYPFWKEHTWDPTAGKPVWIPSYKKPAVSMSGEDEVYDHHLFFDDNIHNLPNDGIACARQEREQEDGTYRFETMDAATMHKDVQGLHLVRVPTIEPVLNPQWYIEQIEEAGCRLQSKLEESL